MNLRQFFGGNNWWGKILGGFFGFLIAGSTGALFGILIGNFFDRGMAEHFSNPNWKYHAEKRKAVQQIFFEATFSVMGHIAKADGRVSEQEIQMARQMMQEMRLNREQKDMAKQYFSQGKEAGYDFSRILTLLQNSCRDNPELLKLFMDIQYRAAKVDGLSEAKIQALNVVFRRLGFVPLNEQYRFYEDFGTGYGRSSSQSSSSSSGSNQRSNGSYSSNNRYQDNSTTSLAGAYALLEVSQTASKHEVKKAYRRLISRNHPDKLIAQGLPEEMIKIANDKTQKITKAYDQICASKGW